MFDHSTRALLGCVLATTAATAQTRWTTTTTVLPFSGSSVATYDPAGNRSLVVQPAATWAVSSYSGLSTQITGATPGTFWSEAAVAYDTLRQRLVLFGGFGASGQALGDTRELAGSTWQAPTLPVSPPARHAAGMCFDAGASVVLLAGGDAGPYGGPAQPLGDVWSWNGQQWSQLPAGPAGPVGPTYMAYDSARARCVALAANGTFEWTGTGFLAVATTSSPPMRRSATFVYDALRERIVLHGGRDPGTSTRSDLWEYDGVDWQQRQPLGEFVRRSAHAAVYDPTRRAVVAFAGNETLIALGGLITTTYVHSEAMTYEAVSPPLVQVFAAGCYFSNNLSWTGLPWLGDTLTLTTSASGPLPPLLAFGASNEQFGGVALPLPLGPLGFPNCELVVAPDVVVAATVSGGTGTVAVPIPNQPLLLGARLYVQGFDVGITNPGTGTFGLLMQIGGR